MEHKAFPVTEFKVLKGADEPGTFEALVAVFGNVDLGGDRIVKGAFSRSLQERGLPPIVWSHNWDIPPIGTTLEAVENNEGLRIKGRLFVADDEDHAIARQVYAAMKATDGNGQPPLREFSFGYIVNDSASVTEDGEEVRELKDVEILEAGPTLMGMNPKTRHLGIKALREELDEIEALASKTSTATAAEDQQAADTPAPNSDEDDEAQAKIRRLLAERPIHLDTEE